MSTKVKVGLLGCGNVGGALVELVAEQREEIAGRTGVDLEITRIAVHSTAKDRGLDVPAELFTTDASAVVVDPEVDVVVETIGGIEPARELVLNAIAAGKPVITANQAMFWDALRTAGCDLTVAGYGQLLRMV